MMGCVSGKDCHDDELPVHRVILSSFFMSKYETTVAQFRAFVEESGRKMGMCNLLGDREVNWQSPGFTVTDDHPVVCVTWHDAAAYAAWLSQKTGKIWQLPSEAQWEYAARAGSNTKYNWGNIPGKNNANYGDGSDDKWEFTAPVGSFKANDLGIYDMHGNVLEWVFDAYDNRFDNIGGDYETKTQTNPKTIGKFGWARRLRSGSWHHDASAMSSAARASGAPELTGSTTGFRLTRQP